MIRKEKNRARRKQGLCFLQYTAGEGFVLFVFHGIAHPINHPIANQ
jgi:hypothetical protein